MMVIISLYTAQAPLSFFHGSRTAATIFAWQVTAQTSTSDAESVTVWRYWKAKAAKAAIDLLSLVSRCSAM
jgi:hypothetical protein